MKDEFEPEILVPIQVQKLDGTGTIDIQVCLEVHLEILDLQYERNETVITEQLLNDAMANYFKYSELIAKALEHGND